jgi:hypothetical protein
MIVFYSNIPTIILSRFLFKVKFIFYFYVIHFKGGTIDITVHQVIVDGKLRELHKASGGAWGGTMVDKAYEQFLADIAGIYDFHLVLY